MSSSTATITKTVVIKQTIKNIKEITKNHSDDEIYSMLKECSMDPNETTQRLLDLDAFHQVKSKRDKRKEVVNSKQGDDSRWNHHHQMRWTRGARGNTFPRYISNDYGGRRGNFARKENGVEDMREKDFRKPTASILKEIDAVQPTHVEKALPVSVNETENIPNGNLGDGPDSKLDRIDSCCTKESLEPICIEPRAHILVDSGLGATESTSNNHLNYFDLDVDGSPTSSSMVDEQETSNQAIVAHPNGSREFPADDKPDAFNSISGVTPSSAQSVNLVGGTDEAASKLVKPKFFDVQHVIIPDHLQVPDAVKDVLSFGSINAGFSVVSNCVKIHNSKDLHSNGDTTPDDATKTLSPCYRDPVSAVTQVDHTDNQQSQSHLRNENNPVDTKVSSSASNNYQLKEVNFPAMGPSYPIVQTAPNYCSGFLPPMQGNTLVQPDGYEYQAHFSNSLSGESPAVSNLSSTLPGTQSACVGPVTMSPQTIPLFQQPYPPNYIPYSHYYSPLYVPPTTMNQYYGHPAFPTPLPSSNVVQPTPISAAAMNNFPPHINTEAYAGNQAPAGEPCGYVAYNSSHDSYGPNAAETSGSLSPSKDVYSRQQGEGAGVWIPTAVQETANSFLNFSLGQHVIYSLPPMLISAPAHPLSQQFPVMTRHIQSAGQSQKSRC